MPQFLDFQAAVVVDGAELPEYAIEVNENKTEVICYIPSEVGKNFAISWRDLKLERGTVGIVHLDGVSVGTKRIHKDSNRRKASRSYYRVSDEMVRPFCFAPLLLTDNEDYAELAEESLGEIRLELREFICYRYGSAYDGEYNRVPKVVTIHEGSKKAMTHCVGYGDDMKKIKSKPLNMLQARGIAPRPQRFSFQKEKEHKESKEADIIEIIDDSDEDREEETGEIKVRLLKRQRTVELEDNAPVPKGGIEAQLAKRQRTTVKSEDKAPFRAYEVIELE